MLQASNELRQIATSLVGNLLLVPIGHMTKGFHPLPNSSCFRKKTEFVNCCLEVTRESRAVGFGT